MTERRVAPMPPGWGITQRRILDRDHRVCYICHKPGATEVDHKIPASRNGTEDDANLGAIHNACHKRKTSWEATGGRRRRTPERHPGDVRGT